jgi:toxin HigB-1
MFTYWVYTRLRVIRKVVLSTRTRKQLRAVLNHVALKLAAWVEAVETTGLESVRKVPGYHDEPLKGDRHGQRSVRLSLAYRAIYMICNDHMEFVSVEEVSKHDY